MLLRNLQNVRGNYVPNQFVFEDDNQVVYFQSYSSVIAKTFYEDGHRRIILGRDWCYSRTTLKYLRIWLADYCNLDMNTQEIRKAIKDGDIEYDDDLI